MLSVVRGRRGPRPVLLLLRLLAVLGIVLLGLPMPSATAAIDVPPLVTGPYADASLAGPAADTDSTPVWQLQDADGSEALHCWFGQGTAPAPGDAGWALCDNGAAIGTPVTYSAAALSAAGTWTLSVAESDGGSYGPVQSSTFTYDPAPVVSVTAPAASGSDDTPSFTVTATDDGETPTVTCSVTGPAAVTDPVSCTGTVTPDLTAVAEGTYTLTVTATDGAGHTDSDSATYELDRQVGTVTVTATPTHGTSTTALFTVALPTPASGDAPYDVDCVVTSTGTPVADTTPVCGPGTTSVSVPLPTEDATHTLTVTATDSSGTTASDSATYTRDATDPTVTWTGGPSGAGQADTATWTWTVVDSNPATAATCTLVTDGVAGTPVPCTSPSHAFALTGEATYGFQVVVTDLAGNDSDTATSPATYRRDTVVPVVTATAPTSPSQQQVVALTATVDDGDAVLECRLVRTAPDTDTVFDWTTCPATDVTLPADGSYTFSARATDDGQTGTASATYVLDRVAPTAVTITRSWATPTGDAAALWGLSAPAAGDTRTCRFTVDGGTPGSWSSCTTSVGFPSATSGSYLLEVRDVDAALNTTVTAAPAVVLDVTAPASPYVATGPSGTAPTKSVTWTFAYPDGTPADPGTTFQCQLRGPTAGSSFAWQTCATPFPYTLTTEGSYVLDVRARDSVGNISALPVGSSAAYLLDSVAPVTPSVLGPSGTGRVTSVAWTFTPDPAASTTDDPVRAVCYRYVGGTLTETIDPCTTPVSRTVSGEGLHRLDVVLVDAADNPSGVGSSPSYLLDTVLPVAPDITAVTGPPPSSTPSITWSWTAETVGSPGRVECRLMRDGSLLGDDFGTACSSPRTYSALSDGSYVLQVRVIDAAGNTGATGSSTAYVIDTGAPSVPTFPGAPSGASTTRDVTWTISAEAGASLTCRLTRTGVTPGSFTACGTSYPVTGLADGEYVLQAIARDAAGNTSGTGSSPAYVVDTTGPTAPTVNGPSGKSNVRAVSWTWTPTEASTTSECQLMRGPSVSTSWASCTSPYAVTLPIGDGTWSLQVRLTDALGNTGATATSAVYDLKTSLPGTPTVTPQSSPSNDTTPTWSFSTEAGTTAECSLVRNGTAGAWTSCGTPATYDLASAGDASYVLQVRLSDTHGNTGTAGSATAWVLDTAAPTAPALTAQPTGPSQDDTPTWTWSAPPPPARSTPAPLRRPVGGRAPRRGRPPSRPTGRGCCRSASPTRP
jgi:hypothetical protein